jgi:hypothetical protein
MPLSSIIPAFGKLLTPAFSKAPSVVTQSLSPRQKRRIKREQTKGKRKN